MSQSAPQSGTIHTAPSGSFACPETDKSITITLAIGKVNAARRAILSAAKQLTDLGVPESENKRFLAAATIANAELKLDLLLQELRAHRDLK